MMQSNTITYKPSDNKMSERLVSVLLLNGFKWYTKGMSDRCDRLKTVKVCRNKITVVYLREKEIVFSKSVGTFTKIQIPSNIANTFPFVHVRGWKDVEDFDLNGKSLGSRA